MRKRIFQLICFCGVFLGLFSACSHSQEGSRTQMSTQAELENIIDSASKERSEIGAYGIGYRDGEDSGEHLSFTYTGKNVIIPYYLEGLAEGVVSQCGLLLLIDGAPQKFCYKEGDKQSEYAYFHTFGLSNKERKDIDLIFTPLVGGKGDTISVFPCAILQPDYRPPSIKDSKFGIYQSLTCNSSADLKMGHTSDSSYSGLSVTSDKKIPKNILDKSREEEKESGGSSLDYLNVGIYPVESTKEYLEVEENQITCNLEIYGGVQGIYRTVFFLNNQPVKINGKDSLLVDMKKEKMFQASLTIEADKATKMNSLYAVTTPTGLLYKDGTNQPCKSESILVVSKGE